jgi:hypothetical protein
VARVVMLLVLLAACGDSAATSDAGIDDAGLDGAATNDARSDAAFDAPPMGQLTPEPLDPVSSACSGIPGYPSPPAVRSPLSSGIVLADVTGDGLADIVSRPLDVLLIARGRGDGTFMASTSIVVLGQGKFGLGDVDGDGDRDFVFGRSGSSTDQILVKFNDGSGAFGVEQLIATGHPAEQIDVIDLDGNGNSDIVALAKSSGTVAVILSQGTSFSAAQVYEVGSAQQFALGDLTNDGRPDLVISNSTEGAVSILLNSGTGTFAERVTYPAGRLPFGVAIADLDSDGANDVLVGASDLVQSGSTTIERGRITTLRNLGAGTLGTPSGIELYDGLAPPWISAADLDGDGHRDVVAGSMGPDVYALRGSATGMLSAPKTFPANPVFALALGDVDGNAMVDLVVHEGTHAFVLRNTGTPDLFDARIRIEMGDSSANIRGLRVLDLNDDTRPDLIAFGTFPGPATATIRLATANGFAASTTMSTAIDGLTSIGDLDNDGRPDIVRWGSDGTNAGLQTLLSRGDGTLTSAAPLPLPSRGMTDVIVADIDGNGFRDVVVGTLGPFPSYASTVHFHSGLGDGTFSSAVIPVWSGNQLRRFAVADVDADGRMDVVISNASTTVLTGTGSGTFAAPLIVQSAGEFAVQGVRDVTGDGKLDLVGSGADDGNGLVVIPATAAGSFGTPIVSTGSAVSEPPFADLNGDGVLDIVGHAGVVATRTGLGTGAFTNPASYPAGGYVQNVEVSDLDQDGRLDFVVNDGPTSLAILYGRCL